MEFSLVWLFTGIFIGSIGGILTISLLSAGKTEDLYSEISDLSSEVQYLRIQRELLKEEIFRISLPESKPVPRNKRNPKIKKYEHKNRILIICGNPIINEKLNPSSEIFFNDIIEKKNYTKIREHKNSIEDKKQVEVLGKRYIFESESDFEHKFTNYFIQTSNNKFILTIYEKRVQKKDLPFFMKLMEKLEHLV